MAEYLRNRGYIKGVDISNWQPNVNYRALKNAGVEIVIMKASESNYYKDKYLEQHYKGCKALGIKVGFYHFFRCDKNATEQARFFVNCISGKSFDVKLVLDIETDEGQNKSTITAMAREFLEEVKRLTGTEPMIYTFTSFANSYLDSSLACYPKWIAHYSPQNPNSCSLCDSNGWDGFQFASDGYIEGSGYPNLDINEFKPSVYVNGKTVSTSGGNVQVQQTSQAKVSREWSNQYDSQILELQKLLNAKGKGFNLVEDGIMGEKTYSALCNYTFDLGDKGELCKWIQNRLNSLGFNCGNPDGIIGNNTINAIHSWQKANGLGEGTMYGSDFYYFCKEPVNNSQAQQTQSNSRWDYQYDEQILELQKILNRKGFNLIEDGIMGDNTYNALCNYSFDYGDQGELCKWIQNRLNSLGFNCGNPDGVIGNNTVNAIHAFQRANGLGEGKMYNSDFIYLCR